MPRRLTAVLERSGARRSRRPARSDEAPQLSVLRARQTTNHAPARDAGQQLPSLRRLGAQHRLRSRAALILAALACGFLIAFLVALEREPAGRAGASSSAASRSADGVGTARPPRHPQGAVLGTVGGDGLAATALHDLHPVAALPALKLPRRHRAPHPAPAPARRRVAPPVVVETPPPSTVATQTPAPAPAAPAPVAPHTPSAPPASAAPSPRSGSAPAADAQEFDLDGGESFDSEG